MQQVEAEEEATSEVKTAPPTTRGLPDPEDMLHDLLELRGWELRKGQHRMVNMVADSVLDDDGPADLAVNAPVGTGKTLGYLAGALASDQRVMVCTSTKALQDQIVYSELPQLQKDIKELYDYDLTFTMLKGKSNYLCLDRARAVIEGTIPDDEEDGALFKDIAAELVPEDINLLKEIVEYVEQAIEAGDPTRLDVGDKMMELPPSIRSQVNSSKGCGECRRRWWELDDEEERQPMPIAETIENAGCAYRLAYAHALNSDVIVVNTSLLTAEMNKSAFVGDHTPQLLPDCGVVVIDEAHHLARILTDSMRSELDFGTITDIAKTHYRRLANHYEKYQDRLSNAEPLIDKHHRNIMKILSDENAFSTRKGRYQIAKELFTLKDELEELKAGVSTVLAPPGSENPEKDIKKVRRSVSTIENDVLEQIMTAALHISQTVVDEETDEKSFAYEVTASGGELEDAEDEDSFWLSIDMVPIDLSFFRESLMSITSGDNLYSDTSETLVRPEGKYVGKVIMTSGTITAETPYVVGMFDAEYKKVPSPFSQLASRLFVPTGLDNPNYDEWKDDAWEIAKEAVLTAGGRTMFLTTSYWNLDYFADRALEDLPSDIEILYQGNGMTRSELLERKAENPYSVLFGTTSFWEGVDIPGKSLSLVIIDKIMFPQRNDPVFSARRRWAEDHGRNPFMTVDVDHAAIMFAQGAGRLIRSVGDRGGIICLDSRVIENKYYGTQVTKLLPAGTPVTSNLDEFNEWIEWVVNREDDEEEIPKPEGSDWRSLRAKKTRRRGSGRRPSRRG